MTRTTELNKGKFDLQTAIWTIGSAYFMVILNPNSDMVHVVLSLLIGFLLDRYEKIGGFK